MYVCDLIINVYLEMFIAILQTLAARGCYSYTPSNASVVDDPNAGLTYGAGFE